ncbi:uncharacterized protein [Onthophagus taurus]|uniref:uncharacterized protein n=1 Tax=Onthophagus taurus TaxID=166361 RepID=UPI0039BE88D1
MDFELFRILLIKILLVLKPSQIESIKFAGLKFISTANDAARVIKKTADYGNLRVRVSVPQFKVYDEIAQFLCEYNLKPESLYSVKWYKDNEEFYRYVPKRKPPATSFKVEGVNVNINASDSKRVLLKSVGLKTSGLFRCEVSAEAPSFASAQSEARMEIIYFSKHPPTISNIEKNGAEFNLNCTSGKTFPMSTLYWYINNKKIDSGSNLIQYPHYKDEQGLITTTLGLKFISKPEYFSMEIKCVSSLWPLPLKVSRNEHLEFWKSKGIQETVLIVTNSSFSLRFLPYFITISVLICLYL